jgi:hypothetical protein
MRLELLDLRKREAQLAHRGLDGPASSHHTP